MHHFTIRDIENLSGIKAHTIRIWEQRYNLLEPLRIETQHRVYNNNDLKKILRVAFLYHRGVKISKIASLRDDSLNQLVETQGDLKNSDYSINQLMEASIDFDEQKFSETLQYAFRVFGIEDGMTRLLFPYMEKIGWLWVTGHFIPAQEHFSSSIIKQKLLVAIDGLLNLTPANAPTWVLFTPENEYHEISLLYIYYLLKKYGKRCIYFGLDVSIELLVTLCQHTPVDVLQFHLTTNFLPLTVNAYLEQLAETFSSKKIIGSGRAVQSITHTPANIQLIHNPADFIKLIKN